MTRSERIAHLKTVIRERLTPLLTADYVLLECPYYANIGDTLIWEGELAFLAATGRRMLGYGSVHTWGFPPLDPATVVILRGGGSFGDLWEGVQEFRLRVIEAYPGNPIVIFPQTVFYRDPARMHDDARRMAAHPNLTLCARDEKSLAVLQEHFRNPALLVPDLAFFIPKETLEACTPAGAPEGSLYLKRDDKEFAAPDETAIPAGAVVGDWPTMRRRRPTLWLIYKLSGAVRRLDGRGRCGGLRNLLAGWADRLAMRRLRPAQIRAGVRFIAPYRTVCSTRLHGVILALLLGKEVVVLDNSYGKLSSFYDTWLTDTDGISAAASTQSKAR